MFLIFLSINLLSAQNVYRISWEQGINSAVASPTIEVGDTVIWVWTDATQKTVTSLPNGNESFDSGIMSGNKEFSFTFSNQGITEYQNDNNPNMNGKITVVGKLSTEDKFLKNLNFYPNPVRNELNISSYYKIDTYQIYNVLGTLVSEGKGTGNVTQVDMTRLNSGLYFVKVSSNGMQTTLKIAKK